MRLLLGSGGFRTDERREGLRADMRELFGDAESILFVPHALADHDGYVKALSDKGLDAGYRLDGLHRHDDPVAAVQGASGIYVGGGNTFRLVRDLHQLGVMDTIRSRVADGMPFMGVSAGTNVACPTMMTTNDMPITLPPSFETLGLVPFQINPHYYSGQVHVKEETTGRLTFQEHYGETRDERIAEYHELNERVVVGLWEGGVLKVDGTTVRLEHAGARIFRAGEEPVDVEAGARLDDLLQR